jgi:lysozyme family protein
MAIINMTFDTLTKNVTVLKDNEKIENVYYIEMYCWKEENEERGHITIDTSEMLEGEKIYKTTKIVADNQFVSESKANPELVDIITKTIIKRS